MPEHTKDLSIEPASRLNSAPAAGAPERASEQRVAHQPSRERGERPQTPPADGALPAGNPAYGIDDKEAYAGRPDQGVGRNVGTGAGGATDWGTGMKDHPSRRAGHPDPS